MSETPPAVATYASVDDVVVVLGRLGPEIRDREELNLTGLLEAAHAAVLDRLVELYGGIPAVASPAPAWQSVRWAEAQITAADVLDILRAATGDESLIPERLRASAWAKLDGGLPGLPVGNGPDVPTTPAPQVYGGPLVSNAAPGSVFGDPYWREHIVADPLFTPQPLTYATAEGLAAMGVALHVTVTDPITQARPSWAGPVTWVGGLLRPVNMRDDLGDLWLAETP